MGVTVRALRDEDHSEWERLYEGYAAFYKVDQTPAMRDTVWSWIANPSSEVEGLAAIDDSGRLVGIAHFRPFARPLSATVGGFLDDLFVDPRSRGLGVADALLDRLKAEGSRRGWSVIRWITAEDNYRARARLRPAGGTDEVGHVRHQAVTPPPHARQRIDRTGCRGRPCQGFRSGPSPGGTMKRGLDLSLAAASRDRPRLVARTSTGFDASQVEMSLAS
jgi:GNAT superfamily N-acetyltransferase